MIWPQPLPHFLQWSSSLEGEENPGWASGCCLQWAPDTLLAQSAQCGPSLALVSVAMICLGLQLQRLPIILSDGVWRCSLRQLDCYHHSDKLTSL